MMLRQMLEKLFGGIAIGVFVAVALFARVGDQPRLWDVLSERLSPAAAPNGPNVIWVDSQRPVTRMMVTGDSNFAPQAAAAAAVGPAPIAVAAPIHSAAPSGWRRHISGMLALFDIAGPATERSSASASAPSAAGPATAAPASAAGGAAAGAVAAAAKPAAAQSYVNYGASSRSDIMSSASGSVYNFSGGKR